MTFIKELLQLIKWLFSGNPKKSNNIVINKFVYFPFSGYSAMSWCGHLISKYQPSDVTVRHETIHLLQAHRFGSWVGYYLSYAWEWVKGNPFSGSAYYTNPYEMEAYANEDRPGYIVDYNPDNIRNYYISRRPETYSKYGNPATWKSYLKTLPAKEL